MCRGRGIGGWKAIVGAGGGLVGLEPADKFQIDQARGQTLRDGVGGVRKVFDQHIGDGIGAVDEVKDLKGGPDVFKIPEWVVAAPVALFAIQQQGAEADIDPDIGVDSQVAAVAKIAGDIEWKVASVQQVQESFEVFVGGEVVLQEQAKGKEPVGGSSNPPGPGQHAVGGLIEAVQRIGIVACIDLFH